MVWSNGVAQQQSTQRQLSPEESRQLAETFHDSERVVQLYKAGKYDEALGLAKRVLEIRQRIFGSNDGRTAAAAINLAEIYHARGDYGEAQKIYEGLLPVYEKTFGVDHVNTAMIVDSLALESYLKGAFKIAEEFYARGVAMRERTLGPEHEEIAGAAFRLAEFYRSRGEYARAEPLYLRAISINDRKLPKDSAEAAHMLQRYECFLYESKGYQEGYRRITEFEKKREPNGPDIVRGDVLNGKAVSLPTPAYPDEARAARASGVVIIQVTIDETGKVVSAKTVCGHPVFAKVCLEAANRARFTPTKLSGKPIRVDGIIIYNFVRY